MRACGLELVYLSWNFNGHFISVRLWAALDIPVCQVIHLWSQPLSTDTSSASGGFIAFSSLTVWSSASSLPTSQTSACGEPYSFPVRLSFLFSLLWASSCFLNTLLCTKIVGYLNPNLPDFRSPALFTAPLHSWNLYFVRPFSISLLHMSRKTPILTGALPITSWNVKNYRSHIDSIKFMEKKYH